MNIGSFPFGRIGPQVRTAAAERDTAMANVGWVVRELITRFYAALATSGDAADFASRLIRALTLGDPSVGFQVVETRLSVPLGSVLMSSHISFTTQELAQDGGRQARDRLGEALKAYLLRLAETDEIVALTFDSSAVLGRRPVLVRIPCRPSGRRHSTLSLPAPHACCHDVATSADSHNGSARTQGVYRDSSASPNRRSRSQALSPVEHGDGPAPQLRRQAGTIDPIIFHVAEVDL